MKPTRWCTRTFLLSRSAFRTQQPFKPDHLLMHLHDQMARYSSKKQLGDRHGNVCRASHPHSTGGEDQKRKTTTDMLHKDKQNPASETCFFDYVSGILCFDICAVADA